MASGQSVLQEFYTTSQKSDESVAAWGLRLEEILQKAISKGQVRNEEKNEYIRNKFWRSLRSELLKNATRVQFYNITDYESLLRAVRKEEYENDISTGMKHQAYIVTTPVRKGSTEEDLKTEDVYEELASLRKEVQEL